MGRQGKAEGHAQQAYGVVRHPSPYTTGTRTAKVDPTPTRLSTPIDPPSSSANFFVIDNPRPVPFCSVSGTRRREDHGAVPVATTPLTLKLG